MRKQLVVIGNGMAGVRCVEEIVKLAPDTFEITIFGTEKHPKYKKEPSNVGLCPLCQKLFLSIIVYHPLHSWFIFVYSYNKKPQFARILHSGQVAASLPLGNGTRHCVPSYKCMILLCSWLLSQI